MSDDLYRVLYTDADGDEQVTGAMPLDAAYSRARDLEGQGYAVGSVMGDVAARGYMHARHAPKYRGVDIPLDLRPVRGSAPSHAFEAWKRGVDAELDGEQPKPADAAKWLGVRWFEGFGEHDFTEASSAVYGTLRELVDALASTVPEQDVFQALVEGRQDTVYWVRDDLGFELFMVGEPHRCAHCGQSIEPTGGHDWIGPIPEPGQPQKRYHLSTDFPECRRASGACGGAS